MRDRKAAKAAEDENLSRLPQDSKISDWPVEKNLEHLTVDQALSFLDQIKDQKFFLGVSLVKLALPLHDPAEVLRYVCGQRSRRPATARN